VKKVVLLSWELMVEVATLEDSISLPVNSVALEMVRTKVREWEGNEERWE
jgi:hypothetical protein